MAIGPTCVWEVRTTGNANNGGGYTSGGTDYSQQDSAQLSLTDLAMNQNSTTLTSATGGFSAAMVGNIILIASGTNFVAGRYEIKTVTDTNTITLDRTAATAGNGSSGVGNVGGAISTLSAASSAVVAGNTVYVKSGTYNEKLTLAVDGGMATPVKWIGYVTSRSTIPTGTNRPLIDAQSTRDYCLDITYTNHLFFNFRMANATSHGVNGTYGKVAFFKNCKASNCVGAGFFPKAGHFFNCESNNNSGPGFQVHYWGNWVNCYSHDNSGYGYITGDSGLTALFCIADSNSNHGFAGQNFGSGVQILANCIAYNNTGSSTNGFSVSSSVDNSFFMYGWNCIAMSNGKYGFSKERSGSYSSPLSDCLYYNNGTAGLQNMTEGENILTSDPLFTNAPNGDFTLQAGSPCLNTGKNVGSNEGLTGTY